MHYLEKNSIYIVSGGSGFGKTSLIKALSEKGYKTGDEVARELIGEQTQINGNVLPWKNVLSFQEEVLKRRICFFEKVELNELAFSDRAIPDQLAFARWRGFKESEKLIEKANMYRYNEKVFITPPWEEIFRNDETRTENFDEACRLHHIILDIYKELDYKIVELPFVSVDKRIDFILNQTS